MTNQEAIKELSDKYSNEVLASAGIVSLARLLTLIGMDYELALSLAFILYRKELNTNSYHFATLADGADHG